jgi:hypothetical protein
MADVAAKEAPQVEKAPNGAAGPAKQPSAPPSWTWGQSGVEVGGKAYVFAPVVPGQVQEYADRLLEVTEAWRLMVRTRKLLEGGSLLLQEGIWEKARLFSRDFIAAQRVIEETVAEIGVFFEPAGIAEAIPGPAIKEFVDQALQRLSENG